MEDPALVTAWATVAIALIAGLGAVATCFLIWRGTVEMHRSSVERAKPPSSIFAAAWTPLPTRREPQPTVVVTARSDFAATTIPSKS